jgi:hypothetical protein
MVKFIVINKHGNESDARLQTATSSGEVYSIISVHKLDERIVPKFFDLVNCIFIQHVWCSSFNLRL